MDNFVVLGPAAGTAGPKLALQGVPEPRAMKNRMHLDLWVDDIEAEAARLTVFGAKRPGPAVCRARPALVQLADPEGNEFCVARN